MPDVTISALAVWAVPFVFLVPSMVAVGIARLVAPWLKQDCDRYLKCLATLLETSLETAVSYRAAGPVKRRPSRPPTRTRAHARPGGTPRPGQKPGASRTRR